MSDGTRRDFMKKAGITGAVLLTYVTPTVETFKIADAWADEEGGWEGHDDEGRRHPSKKKYGYQGEGGESSLPKETTD
ncbi:MAG: twin-arginine translocation signal domain-containing protein [Nitrospinae bacterium]|nr:twin-arginine translocation signal domain-containing protein [Nitrospinota bacterium]